MRLDRPVSVRERWWALGLLLGLLALLYLLLVHPLWTRPLLVQNARIASLQEREARARAQVAQAPQVALALQQAQQALAGRPGFLPEASVELATAGLIQRLESVVLQASPGNRSCTISNRSPLAAAANPGERFARVAVQVRLRCGMPETAAVLHALEGGVPRLFVENLNILTAQYGGSGEGGGGLDVSFDLYGYLSTPAAATGVAGTAAPAAMEAVDAP